MVMMVSSFLKLKGFNLNKITKQILQDHSINHNEYNMILKIMGREPNLLELGIFP